ncbi:serine hydrolase [Paraburkholderia sp. A1RI-2L]|uniref:serine hydrolase n=1 Tax=Paraburkholderia sp. A1RI-2L TaxID=3028367 RepID=UPI003B78B1F9
MTRFNTRRRLIGASLFGTLAACTGDIRPRGPDSPGGVSNAQISAAVDQLDTLVANLMTSSGVPGMSVAVVHGTETIYAKGFGVRAVGSEAAVDADTVFQLASLSKPIGSMVVAHQVGLRVVQWDTPVTTHLPWFALSNAGTSTAVTIGDLYAHRSGLPDHAGDRLEDMGYGQTEILKRLRYLPLASFRQSYFYTNFGLTAAAESVAAATGLDWATLSETTLYQPLGMTSTSSRYADFAARTNRALGHVKEGNHWVLGMGTMPDAQAPAGGVSSSANDMARWLTMMLGQGVVDGRRIVDATALNAAVSAQVQSAPSGNGRPASYYGFGFNVGTNTAGRATYSHSGAFALGAGTSFTVVPSLGLAIVALTNGYPIGVPETLIQQFFDLVQYGAIQRDWGALFASVMLGMLEPEGSLVGVAPPVSPLPARALSTYTGTYQNDYWGPANVIEQAGGLALQIGPSPLTLPLTHWDGDVFTFALHNENAAPGTISKASFGSQQVTLEYYDHEQLGTFMR